MEKRLITSALPYVNNIPHLGNLIQVLSADVFARFCRSRGYETLYVCGTDEYGTATETRALEEGITPKELCDRYYDIHSRIYEWFEISFDRFGRTSTPNHTRITQDIFLKLDKNGYITEKTTEQLYCATCRRFLADRYVRGTCPHCSYTEARGDQCESCGKLLDPVDLILPRCGVCGASPEMRKTNHLYFNLPAVLPKLQTWMSKAVKEGTWARNAVQMTEAWIRDGLKERCITRDLRWGIPVPKDGYREKVFYVWFDAPIGYISITSNHTEQWEMWWKNPEEVKLFQFIGKDNIPFHTVIFPSSLLGSGENWTLLHHMSSTEYLNYESGKFSKSKGIGVFGTDARDTGIPADVWRFYIYYTRPERSDALFAWDDFQMRVNTELIGNLSNLVNRTVTFVHRFYDGKIPQAPDDETFWQTAQSYEKKITDHLESAELREAFKQIFALSSFGNKQFQDGEPWSTRKTDPETAARLLRSLTYLVKDLAILIEPYLPNTASKIREFLGNPALSWTDLGRCEKVTMINKPELLFGRLEDEQVQELRKRFSGSQKEREVEMQQEPTVDRQFSEKIDLRVAQIIDIARHPEADKLYIETIDVGGGEIRQIVSGLVPFYTEEDLKGRNIILVYNLKPAKLRGEKSEGMLLAAESKKESGEQVIEVLFADHAEPGDRVITSEDQADEKDYKKIKIDDFFAVPLTVRDYGVYVGEAPLQCNGKPVKTTAIQHGTVG